MPELVAGIVAIGFVVLWIYCIFDVITTDDAIVQHLPKLVWLMIVILIPDIGSLLWLGVGRPRCMGPSITRCHGVPICSSRAGRGRRLG